MREQSTTAQQRGGSAAELMSAIRARNAMRRAKVERRVASLRKMPSNRLPLVETCTS